ncbi:MAG: 2-hydroxy-3-oxopropionate reductase [uncultured Rubrobacteraceae bacterium]|uniref:2-hydroxy-3-oxopropionate reductase n=1 Tax=uncultured Rubrobacteraceae bacterium TaxID=349277 RepID=A0A6J4SCS9_9ACTN|nr:MAG: 2-hydroxy-3-oxopropionate reductase [uncultured Rubrobacteraceae bacterium]
MSRVSGKVGFVGLGIMGAPMARNLLAAGYELVVYNRSRAKAEGLAGNCAVVAESPAGVARGAEVVVTMLPGPPEVEAVFGEMLGAADEGTLLIDMSTSSPVLARGLAADAREKGIGVLDAPVSGGDVGAIEGTLSIMVGGEEADFERVRPLFEAMGRTITHVGGAGAGQTVKACNQIVVALVIEAVSEALVLGERAGVEPSKVLDVLSGGLAGNKVMEVKREKLLSRDFSPGGKSRFHLKDLGIALAAARESGVPLPVTAVVNQMFGALVAGGRGDDDHSALLALLDGWAGPMGAGKE